jgi:hypothetical protein
LLEIYNDHAAQLQVEFMALINHRKEISKEAARSSEHMRALEAEALARGVLSEYGVEASELSATGLAVILSAIGSHHGHREIGGHQPGPYRGRCDRQTHDQILRTQAQWETEHSRQT